MLPGLNWPKKRDGPHYSAVAKEEVDDDIDIDTNSSSSRNASYRGRLAQISASFSTTTRLIIGLGVILVISLGFSDIPKHHGSNHFRASNDNFFHLLIPASSTSEKLCKTIFSAAALEYPTPRFINWDQPSVHEDRFAGTHLAKITRSLDYLNSLSSKSDNELVLMIDGYDLWFQLRPSVLIDRYYRYIDRQNKRLYKRLGRAMDVEDIYQSVIVSAGGCWPQAWDHPTCAIVPDSVLAHDVYGEITDKTLSRPRWVNSGFIMGPVGDVRKVLKRASVRILSHLDNESDQFLFNEIFAQQEYQREVKRKQYLFLTQRISAGLNGMLGYQDERSKLVLGADKTLLGIEDDVDHECHIALDYTGELSWTLDGQAQAMAWLNYSEPKTAALVSKDRNIPPPIRVTSVPEDIMQSKAPFNITRPPPIIEDVRNISLSSNDQNTHRDANDTLIPQSWNSVPLYTSLYTGVVPALIHYNTPKEYLEWDWMLTWYFPHLREQLQAQLMAPRAPIAVTASGQQWWSSINRKGGAMAETAQGPKWFSWEGLCGTQEDADILFQDQKGPWRDPRIVTNGTHVQAKR